MSRLQNFQPPPKDGPLWREQFLGALGTQSHFYQLFNHVPDVAFFAKDADCRILCASRVFFERFGFNSEEDIIGRDDFELFPLRLAESFRADDNAVLESGVPKLNIVELFFNRMGIPDWYVTNKLPVFDTKGKVIGLMGTTHGYEARKSLLQPFFQLDKAIVYIREHFRDKISIEDLATQVNISSRQLHRKFVEAFGLSPQAFILKLKIQAACDALQQESALISDVARAVGFCDQSAFTQAFHRHIGITPRQFQVQFRLRRV
ncbi:MAG: AraC family transcriptional regulator [Verrucomicrobiota bacterium]